MDRATSESAGAVRAPRQNARGSAEASAWRWLGLHSFEIAALASLVLALAFLRLQGMRIGWKTVEYTVYPMFQSLHVNLLLGIGLVSLYAGWLRVSGAGVGVFDYWQRLRRPGWWILWLRLWFACMVMGYVYFWLKINVPLVNYRLWDAELWQLDALLHLGVSPSIFITQLFEGTVLVGMIDRWYNWWILTVIGTMSFFCAFPEARTRSAFTTSCVLLWTLGAWMYVALPALGPIYVFPQPWNELQDPLPLAEAGQLALWENYQIMLAGRTGQIYEFNPTRGIGALPSLHVGAHWLFALWARREVRVLFAPFVVATFLTLLGSILTGWHYAVDGYVGMVLAWASYRVALWWEGVPWAGDSSEVEAAPDEP